MLIENEAFDLDHPPPHRDAWRDVVIRQSSFDAVDLEGVSTSGLIDGCRFTSVEFYWALFNVASITRSRFEACRFRGVSFRGALIADCSFTDCAFELDNLGGDCTIDDCLMAGVSFERCRWELKTGRASRDVTRTRFLGCTMLACAGFDQMF